MKKIIYRLLVLALAVFVIYNIISLFSSGQDTVIAELDTMEKSYELEGIIIRDEMPITINTKDGGILDVNVTEGEMVRKGKHVATYFDSNIDDETRSELSKINAQISQLQNTADDKVAEQMSIKQIEEEISQKTDDMAFASSDRNMAVISSLKVDINELISKKNSDEEPMTAADKLEALKSEKRRIESGYSGKKIEITAPEHGVFSTRIDGFEETITPELALNITVADYTGAREKKMTADEIRKKGAVCKLVNNSLWYVSVITDEATAKSFAADEKVTLRFEGEKSEAKGKVEYISKSQSGKYMITISSSSYCDYAMEYRFASLTLVKESNTGLKLPLSAIKIKDGKSGVYVKTENTLKYKEVEILSKDEDYAICKFDNTKSNALLLYDEVIINEH